MPSSGPQRASHLPPSRRHAAEQEAAGGGGQAARLTPGRNRRTLRLEPQFAGRYRDPPRRESRFGPAWRARNHQCRRSARCTVGTKPPATRSSHPRRGHAIRRRPPSCAMRFSHHRHRRVPVSSRPRFGRCRRVAARPTSSNHTTGAATPVLRNIQSPHLNQDGFSLSYSFSLFGQAASRRQEILNGQTARSC